MHRPHLATIIFFMCSSLRAQYQPSCTPFPLSHMNDIMARQSFDASCGDTGDPSAAAAKQLQNAVKNNLCATGTPALVTFVTFRNLQAAQHPSNPPNSRTSLHSVVTTSEGDTIGEGSLVHVVAFIMKAKYSDLGGGESVNCNQPHEDQNDIHIALVNSATATNECTSVTAEMIPHYRPRSWKPDAMHHLSLYQPGSGHHKYTDYTTSKRPLVRVTGQLMYDASHSICKNGAPVGTNPARCSNWEVHPVYTIDVCTSAHPQDNNECDPTNDSVWTPLDRWQP